MQGTAHTQAEFWPYGSSRENWHAYGQRLFRCEPIFVAGLFRAFKLGGNGGETGIRTLGTLSSTHAFQACAFSHSAISPSGKRRPMHACLNTPFDCNVLRACSLFEHWPAYSPGRLRFVVLFQLLRQVILVAHLANGVQLRFQPVDVVFFVRKDLLCQLT